ncbi:MAG: ABC transporter permease [Verrucomicrobia bacterium]|jgi:ribose transport system permease protein|nr:ABC transporter permease [Verrucomicrobiota bacterium]
MLNENRGIPDQVTLLESQRPARAVVQRVLREAGIGIALLLLIAVFSATAPHFTDESNITNILTQITINLIMATGMTFVILIGGIDLSVGSVMALSAMVAGLVLKAETLPVPVAIAAAALTSVAVGMICGFVNGFVASFWNVPSFIVTLGMLNIARGGALEVTNARTLFEFPNAFNDFGTATLLRIPAIFLVALGLVLLGWAVLTRTVFGRLIYAIGNNEEAVRLSGHDTFIYKVAAFVISGLTVGIGAIVYMARLTIASPILGTGFELNAIAAVIIGGTSLNGGRGSLIGTFLGACLIGVLADGLILIGVGDFVRQMITGGVIILAVVLDSYRARIAERTR